MIFNYYGKRSLFIHIPKTGGNSIQYELIKRDFTSDKIVCTGHQDGFDRFEIRGDLTKQKHQKFFEYLEKDPSLRSSQVFSVIRKPFERLVSLYFSPNRHFKRNFINRKFYLKNNVSFSEEKFFELVNQTSSSSEMLSQNKKFVELPKNLITMRFEKLNEELLKYFPDFDFSSRKNISKYMEDSKKVLKSKFLRNFVESSFHKSDLENFYHY